MSTWMILRSSAPCSEFGSGNGQPPGLLRFYQEAAWRGDDTLGISLGRGTRNDENACRWAKESGRLRRSEWLRQTDCSHSAAESKWHHLSSRCYTKLNVFTVAKDLKPPFKN